MNSNDEVFAGVSRSEGPENGHAMVPSANGGADPAPRQRSCSKFRGRKARAFREDFTSLLALYVLPTILRLVVLRAMLSAARELGIRRELIRAMSEALEADQKTVHLESVWSSQKGATVKTDARPLDAELDRSLSAFSRLLNSTAESLGESHPRHKAARRLLAVLFPDGVQALTQQSHQAQSASVAALLARTLKSKVSGDLAVLGFSDQVDRIASLHAAFDRALQAGEGLEFSELKRQRDRGRRALRRLVFRILGAYHDDDPHSREVREALLAPLLFHNDQMHLSRRRRRSRSGKKAARNKKAKRS